MYITYLYYNTNDIKSEKILLHEGEKLLNSKNNQHDIFKKCIESNVDNIYIDENKINENSYIIEYLVNNDFYYDINECSRIHVEYKKFPSRTSYRRFAPNPINTKRPVSPTDMKTSPVTSALEKHPVFGKHQR